MANQEDINKLVDHQVEAACNILGFKRVSDELYVARQVTMEELQQLKASGLKSVVSLRLPEEAGNRTLEAETAELGLEFFNSPVDDEALSAQMVDKALATVDRMQKPVLIYCRSGRRALAVGVAHDSLRQEKGAQKPVVGAVESLLASACDKSPGMQAFLTQYIHKKIDSASQLPAITKISNDLYIGPQVTEKDLQELKAQGVRSVLNLREPSEVGELGLGVMAREPAICRELGLEYRSVPVPKSGPSEAHRAEVRAMLDSLPPPTLVHCRSSGRARQTVQDSSTPA